MYTTTFSFGSARNSGSSFFSRISLGKGRREKKKKNKKKWYNDTGVCLANNRHQQADQCQERSAVESLLTW